MMDTGGQERYDAIAPQLLRQADVFMLVYDITNRSTFARLTHWMGVINKIRKESNSLAVMVVGNKTDLDNKREVSCAEGRRFAKEHKMQFFEVSAKTGYNVFKAFQYLLDALVDHEKFIHFQRTLLDTIQNPKEQPRTSNSGCCGSRSENYRVSQDPPIQSEFIYVFM